MTQAQALYKRQQKSVRMIWSLMRRLVHDFGVLYFGAPVFKLLRLVVCVVLVVHVLACGFYRIKVESSPPEVVDDFFQSRGVDPQARCVSSSACKKLHNCHFRIV